MVKSKIIFYGKKSDVYGLSGTFLFKPEYQITEMDRIIKMFDNKDVKCLFVHISMCVGWRTKLTEDECVVLFTEEFTPGHILNAKDRLSMKGTIDESCVDEERNGGKSGICIETPEDSKTS